MSFSFGTSPTPPSLLIPANPAYASTESAPRGGILINVQRAGEPSPSISTSLGFGTAASHAGSSPPDSPTTPSHVQDASPSQGSTSLGPDGKPLKIRFAPLPDPRRPRSLSTGRNIAWTAQIGEDGTETRGLAIKGHDTDDYAVEDDDEEEEGGEEGEGEDGNGGSKRGRSWSQTMGSSWKGTKKLLSGKNPVSSSKDKEEPTYSAGAPLKKSVSTGGLIGSSPFRWTAVEDRRRSMQGSSPPTVSSLLSAHRPSLPASSSGSTSGHRRNSSLEPGGAPVKRSTSPSLTPIKMMNGRVYGSRRASEAAERERQIREKMEPAFVEWGHGQGSVATVTPSTLPEEGNKGFLGDADDGGGMAWVKRRREERMKREKEEKERKEAEERARAEGGEGAGQESPTAERNGTNGYSSDHSSTSSLDLGGERRRAGTTDLKTPAIPASDLPPTPIIQVSDVESQPRTTMEDPAVSPTDASDIGPKGERMSPAPSSTGPPIPVGKGKTEHGHVVQAMRIPSDSTKKQAGLGQPVDVFGDAGSGRRDSGYEDEEDEDEDEDDDEEDDGDFDDDEDEEIDVRTTSSAAGVEVFSQHK
ncbi:hypothetical protein IAU60_002673 [Kwoniella sp. DSM 27419]